MDHSERIVELFSRVLDREKNRFAVNDNAIVRAYDDMKEAYRSDPKWRGYNYSKKVDYNDAAHRCAYLHKHAMLHTGLVCEILQEAFRTYSIKQTLSRNNLKVCSLGGGPGTDIVALLFVLQEEFGLAQCDATILDLSGQWKQSFESAVSELRKGPYAAIAADGYFRYRYEQVDLLNDTERAIGYIREADVITMVKFVSAAASDKTQSMIQTLFKYVEPETIVLFIDNAGGGFLKMLEAEASKNDLVSIFGPLYHREYEEARFKKSMCGRTSQFRTTVAAVVWIKAIRAVRQCALTMEDGDETDSISVGVERDREENEGSSWKCCLVM